MSGDPDDPEYIRRAGRIPVSGRPNVAALWAGVSSSQLEQFVSLVAYPAGLGVPGALRFGLALHHLEHLPNQTQPYCTTECQGAVGDERVDLRRATGLWTSEETTPSHPLGRQPRRPLDGVDVQHWPLIGGNGE
jgi:molybdopterin-synthase adenylyltransferase